MRSILCGLCQLAGRRAAVLAAPNAPAHCPEDDHKHDQKRPARSWFRSNQDGCADDDACDDEEAAVAAHRRLLRRRRRFGRVEEEHLPGESARGRRMVSSGSTMNASRHQSQSENGSRGGGRFCFMESPGSGQEKRPLRHNVCAAGKYLPIAICSHSIITRFGLELRWSQTHRMVATVRRTLSCQYLAAIPNHRESCLFRVVSTSAVLQSADQRNTSPRR